MKEHSGGLKGPYLNLSLNPEDRWCSCLYFKAGEWKGKRRKWDSYAPHSNCVACRDIAGRVSEFLQCLLVRKSFLQAAHELICFPLSDRLISLWLFVSMGCVKHLLKLHWKFHLSTNQPPERERVLLIYVLRNLAGGNRNWNVSFQLRRRVALANVTPSVKSVECNNA